MVNPIPSLVRKLWDEWNIRLVILTSLFLQIFLILFAPFRKSNHRSLVTWSLWSAYLLADCAANFCIGLISDRRDDINTINVHDYILAFWAPFLLLHLGGPDTITAFALEDNELWLRHLLGLLFQLAATVYVFLLTMPSNNLWIPTVLVFLSGLIKYTERTRSLYSASMDTFRRSMIREPDAGPNYAKLMEEFSSKKEAGIPCSIVVVPEPDQKGEETKPPDDKIKLTPVQVVQYAYEYFNKFKGLIVDLIYSSGDRNTSRDFFLSLNTEDAFRITEVELNFIYEVFFTKVPVLRSWIGCSFRFVSFSCIAAAIVLFTLDQKHGFSGFDVRVSYTLLYGALALDSLALLMLVFSDRTVVLYSNLKSQLPDESERSHQLMDYLVNTFLLLKEPKWSNGDPKPKALATHWLFRRWSGKVSGHNLIEYCLHKSRDKSPKVKGECEVPIYVTFAIYNKLIDFLWAMIEKIGAKELVEKWCYKKNYPLLWELWEFIFQELKEKSNHAKGNEGETTAICTARGEWVIKNFKNSSSKDDGLKNLTDYVNPDNVAFDESLLLWHIATSLCYYDDGDLNKESSDSYSIWKKLATCWCWKGNKGSTNHEDGDPNGGTSMSHDGSDPNKGSTSHENGNPSRGTGTSHDVSDPNKGSTSHEDGDPNGGTGTSHDVSDPNKGSKSQNDVGDPNKVLDRRVLSKHMSDYMLYLSVMEPSVMAPVAGIGQLRFQDTCEEAKKFFRKRLEEGEIEANNLLVLVCCWRKEAKKEEESYKKLLGVRTEKKPIEVKGDRSKSLLFDGCMLAKEIKGLEKGKRWEVIAKVWVELLSFGASNCNKYAAVQQLSRGGELISFVWLLMVQLGLGTQFQIKEGHARAKLIVGDEEGDTASTT